MVTPKICRIDFRLNVESFRAETRLVRVTNKSFLIKYVPFIYLMVLNIIIKFNPFSLDPDFYPKLFLGL